MTLWQCSSPETLLHKDIDALELSDSSRNSEGKGELVRLVPLKRTLVGLSNANATRRGGPNGS